MLSHSSEYALSCFVISIIEILKQLKAGWMVQWVNVLAPKPDDLRSMHPDTHIVDVRTNFYKLSSNLHMFSVACITCTYIQAHVHTYTNTNLKLN